MRVLLILATTVGLLVSAAGPTFGAVPAHQPDLLIGSLTPLSNCCHGLATYEAWPHDQILPVTVKRGGRSVLFVPITNGGHSKDRFRITGEGSYSGVHVRYFDGMPGSRDVTGAVVGNGFVVSNLKPGGGSATLGILVTAPAALGGFTRSIRVIARTVGKPHAMDAVSFLVTVIN